MDSYELGAKTTWLSGSLLLNATLFHQTFENFQLNTFLGTSFIVESIPEVTSKGVDADMVWFSPIEGLTVQGGVTYADTKYGNFTAADLGSADRFAPLSLLPAPRSRSRRMVGRSRGPTSRFGGLLARFNLGPVHLEYNTGSDLLPARTGRFAMLNGRLAMGPPSERGRSSCGAEPDRREYLQVAFNAPLQGSAFPPTSRSTTRFDNQTYSLLGHPGPTVTLRVEYTPPRGFPAVL